MFKRIAITVSAATLVMLAIALAPAVPTALATARTTTTIEDATLNQPLADQPCAALEAGSLIQLAANRMPRKPPERSII